MFKPCGGYAPEGPITFSKHGSPKLDGIRSVTIHGSAWTKSMKPVPNNHIRTALLEVAHLDGELICGSPTDEGVYLKTYSAVMSHEGKPDFTFYVFDDLSNFALTFEQRLNVLSDRKLPSFVQVLPQTELHNQNEFDSYYANLLDLGYEGAILRNRKALYKFGKYTAKSQDLLKFKPIDDFESEILSVYEAMENTNLPFLDETGRTKRSTDAAGLVPKGTLGGFVCRRLRDGLIHNCAPGKFDHKQRLGMFKNPPIGQILKVRSMGYGATAEAPRHARALGFRSPLDM